MDEGSGIPWKSGKSFNQWSMNAAAQIKDSPHKIIKSTCTILNRTGKYTEVGAGIFEDISNE